MRDCIRCRMHGARAGRPPTHARYTAEVIYRRAPWKTEEAVELATLEWVAWINNHRLLAPIGNIPPAEAEATYYRQLASQAVEVAA